MLFPRCEVFAVLFTQAIHDHIYVDMLPMPADAEVASDRYFGSLLDSMLRHLLCHGRFCICGFRMLFHPAASRSLFCETTGLFMSIAGGVSWEEVLLPLRHVSSAWIWTFCFIFYISFTYFAVSRPQEALYRGHLCEGTCDAPLRSCMVRSSNQGIECRHSSPSAGCWHLISPVWYLTCFLHAQWTLDT